MLKNYCKNKQNFQNWAGNTQIRYCRTDKMPPNQNHSHLKHVYLISKNVDTLKWQQITPYSSCLFTFYVMCTFIFVDSCQNTRAKPFFYELIHSLVSKDCRKNFMLLRLLLRQIWVFFHEHDKNVLRHFIMTFHVTKYSWIRRFVWNNHKWNNMN